ncbi:hypothetical protein [Conexibacter woesei]|uniref:Uncharacterized protein n=1 Tax=Conexibacter woesei (strain DSM 14684 / CCUG 47730 / CIP 108061 / JCM 11494 / NBRC 100937 / ID131577) TaxID=469383 RepID=D3F9F1_CONWI|nr:hypothetical protein [Conexibacter woesei]ADB49118.1 hypothetical protein Cwoe_0684 [Conexibacter woesei DSM 14684]
MIATTVRFDADTWTRLGARSEQLGIAKAKYIHDATLARLAGHETAEQLAGAVIDRLVRERFGDLIRTVVRRLQRTELLLARPGTRR